MTRVDEDGSHVLATDVPCPPCNIGPLSTPDYMSLANAAVTQLDDGMKVFAGQRAEGFYVDLGAIFDLGDLRPFEQDHNDVRLVRHWARQDGRRCQLHRRGQRPHHRRPGPDPRALGQRPPSRPA